eukprot:CAMPEP_0174728740 /NCGR_PEP_ID=MMETSP1094-20130205/52303_1 /TAXON_ID=156173 /ORGANISM="Chrysochromulina brevifilum, Strain UTEX LB 985" /LENGTH=63 /DNA_ID=CAMNT_0015930719 /DNA_START=349 /DNA_END=537 /DNA_ORIENTATION=+
MVVFIVLKEFVKAVDELNLISRQLTEEALNKIDQPAQVGGHVDDEDARGERRVHGGDYFHDTL